MGAGDTNLGTGLCYGFEKRRRGEHAEGCEGFPLEQVASAVIDAEIVEYRVICPFP
jgi:hypothetical protein